jgi:hypothetical protein
VGYGSELESGVDVEGKKEVTRHVKSDNSYETAVEEGLSHRSYSKYHKRGELGSTMSHPSTT